MVLSPMRSRQRPDSPEVLFREPRGSVDKAVLSICPQGGRSLICREDDRDRTHGHRLPVLVQGSHQGSQSRRFAYGPARTAAVAPPLPTCTATTWHVPTRTPRSALQARALGPRTGHTHGPDQVNRGPTANA